MRPPSEWVGTGCGFRGTALHAQTRASHSPDVSVVGCSCWSDAYSPSMGGPTYAEHSHAGEVGRTGQEPEVGVDTPGAADPGPSPAVCAAHQVPELAFHLGAGRAVVRDPPGVGLPKAGIGQCLLMRADADRATVLGGGALRPEPAASACRPEVGDGAAVAAAGEPERCGDPGRAG